MGRRWGIIPTRGVYQGLAFSGALTSGSSPLARGLRGPSPPACLDLGIIPARAGFTGRQSSSRSFLPDHPRSRGVYPRRGVQIHIDRGSSPLARGLPGERGCSVSVLGIIPARAGFTPWPHVAPHILWDHPRSRGVYISSRNASTNGSGSSPLARGLPHPFLIGDTHERIIPARAGFTAGRASALRGVWDHPRSRGVYSHVPGQLRASPGSSPLARGLHLRILGIPTNPYSTRPLLPSLPT